MKNLSSLLSVIKFHNAGLIKGSLRQFNSSTLIGLSRYESKISGPVVRSTTIFGTHHMKWMSSYQQKFDEAKVNVTKLSEDPGNEAKLNMYGLFKQATEGSVQTKRPGMMDFVARAKWDAWNSHKDMDKEAAQKAYIDFVNSLMGQEAEVADQQTSDQKYKCLLVEDKGKLRVITLNRPTKMNALTMEMYNEIIAALKEAKNDPRTSMVAFTGAGKYYCSGNDLSNFANITPDKMQEMASTAKKILHSYVSEFIDFPKPLVAIINGPAIGIAVTILGLFDAVYASDKATFHTPFTSLGQSPEGCSSFIFPRLMGYGKASEMLFFNKKITATEAYKLNLVTEVLPEDVLQKEIWPRLEAYSKLPVKSLVYSKELVRHDREHLHKVNQMECERLGERWLSDDCINAIVAFFNRK